MNKELFIKHYRYLTLLVGCAIKKCAPPEPFDSIDWCFLIKIAAKQNLLLMISTCLEVLILPESAKDLYKKLHNFYLARLTRQTIESARVLSALENGNIRYIKLKGAHIKEYYPDPYMRSFNDVDLFIDVENRDKAIEILKSCDYELTSVIDYHDEFEKDNFFIYELHTKIVSEIEEYADVFQSPFEHSVAEKENKCYKLKNEYLYLHLFFHLYKHFNNTGCGIRFFADFLVFEKYVTNVDYNLIYSILKKYKMLGFQKTLESLKSYFFDGKKVDKSTEKIAMYIFTSATTGDYTHRIANFNIYDKLKYLFDLWFPPANRLIFRYPVLEKAPFLLPICWIRRFFYSLFFKRIVFKEQTNNIKSLNRKEFKAIKKARKLATKNKI